MEALKLIFNILWTVLVALVRKVWPLPKKSIEGEIALVTGAAHGLGRGIALRLASLGAKVIGVCESNATKEPHKCKDGFTKERQRNLLPWSCSADVVDINQKGNEDTAAKIRLAGGQAFSFKCDLSDKESIKSLAQAVKTQVGDVSFLVNNAGIVFVSNLEDRTDDMIATTFNVNCFAHFRLIKEFLPAMKRNNHGHVVSIASLAAYLSAPYLTDYCASKAAVISMMDSFRREMRWLGHDGVKGSCVCMSWINTGFAKNPQTGNATLSPILEVKDVVDATIEGLLTEQETIEIPSAAGIFFLKALFPQKVVELCFDYVRPSCDRVDEKKKE